MVQETYTSKFLLQKLQARVLIPTIFEIQSRNQEFVIVFTQTTIAKSKGAQLININSARLHEQMYPFLQNKKQKTSELYLQY